MCGAQRQEDGAACRRDATVAVIVDEVVRLLCDADGWRAAREAGTSQVRELRHHGARMRLTLEAQTS